MIAKFYSPRNTSLVVGITTEDDVYHSIRFRQTSRNKPAYYICRDLEKYQLLKSKDDFGILFFLDEDMDDFAKVTEDVEEDTPPSPETSLTASSDDPEKGANVTEDVEEETPPTSSPAGSETGVSDEGNGVSKQNEGDDNPNTVVETNDDNEEDPNDGIEVIPNISSVPDVKQWLVDNKGIAKVKMPNIQAIKNVCLAQKVQFPEFEKKHS